MSTYPITGIKKGLGPGEQVPLRREVDEWWFSKDINSLNQRTLFISALIKFMAMEPKINDPSDLSYYSIGGIHGQPLTPWDTNDKKAGFYCAHRSVLFPSWHRPYMLLYEQRLYEIMKKLIPETFSAGDQAAMNQAADTWRLPFWDWAIKKPVWDPSLPEEKQNLRPVAPNVPFVLTQKTVEIKTGTGVSRVENPLWRYSIPSKKNFGSYGIDLKVGDRDYAAPMVTSRYPTVTKKGQTDYEKSWLNGDEINWKSISGQLGSGAKDDYGNTLPERVYRLFSYAANGFNEFATDVYAKGQPVRTFGSLEAVHGDVHGLIGGAGQMGQIAVAGFDPIFWLHHCNIDRLFAIWQDMFPSQYKEWLNKNAKAKLPPFHHDKEKGLWDAERCSFQQKNLGYTYPDLQRWLDIYKVDGVFNEGLYIENLGADVELKYSTTGKKALSQSKNRRIAQAHMAAMKPENLAIENFPPALMEMAAQTPGGTPSSDPPPQEHWQENDYVVDIVYDPFALEGGHPYSVRFFLGVVPDQDWTFFEETPNQISLIYNFSGVPYSRGAGPEGCDNCKTDQEQGVRLANQIPLTDYLISAIEKGEVSSLERDDIVPYLRKNLHWRITGLDNAIVPKENMPSLTVSVAVAIATHYTQADRFSEYSAYDILWDVTQGRLAGANPGDMGFT